MRIKSLFALGLAGAALAVSAVPAAAAMAAPRDALQYRAQSFAALQRSGRTIVVDVRGENCADCAAVDAVLAELREDPKLEDVVFVSVDWDKDKAFLEARKITAQPTVLVFKGTREVARTTPGQGDVRAVVRDAT